MSLSVLLLPSTLGGYAGLAALERIPSLRFKTSPFLRPFFRTDVLWQLSTFSVVLAARDVSENEQVGVPDEVETYPQGFPPAFLEPLRRILSRGQRTTPLPSA